MDEIALRKGKQDFVQIITTQQADGHVEEGDKRNYLISDINGSDSREPLIPISVQRSHGGTLENRLMPFSTRKFVPEVVSPARSSTPKLAKRGGNPRAKGF